MQRRVNYVYTTQDVYKIYKKHTQDNIGGRIPEPKFREIFNTFLESYIKICWDKGQPAKFPLGIGSVYVIKKKAKTVDIYQTKIQRKRVYFDLDSTGGYTYRIRGVQGSCPYSSFYKIVKGTLRSILLNRIRDYVKLGRYYPSYKIL